MTLRNELGLSREALCVKVMSHPKWQPSTPQSNPDCANSKSIKGRWVTSDDEDSGSPSSIWALLGGLSQVTGPALFCWGIKEQLRCWPDLDNRLCQRPPTQEQGTRPQESKGRNSTVVPLTAFLKLRGGPSAQELNMREGEIKIWEETTGWSLMLTTIPGLSFQERSLQELSSSLSLLQSTSSRPTEGPSCLKEES